jgi:hypothetical protein
MIGEPPESAEDDGYWADGSKMLSFGWEYGLFSPFEMARNRPSISDLKLSVMAARLDRRSGGISSQSGKVHLS